MILHLVSTHDWNAAPPDQPFTPKAYAADGFIHCTFGDALMLSVANRFYKSQPGEFLAIAIDETRVSAWAGLRPATPGNLPLIGKTPWSNLWLNTGHGTLGWTLACGSAASVVDLMRGQRPAVAFPFRN